MLLANISDFKLQLSH